ncbi:MAG TPA: GH25 family lysozyme [Mycobacteriales bacterium]|nr:GH25 family lysozyme [Mycobacteriales bacterium]
MHHRSRQPARKTGLAARRSRRIAGIALALSLMQLTVMPAASQAACLLCQSSPTASTSSTDTASATPSTSPSPTASPTATASTSPSQSPTVSPSPTSTGAITGPDVASYQHPATAAYPNGKPINWNAVANDGMEFAFAKASESTTYKNPYFAADYAGMAAAGLVRGAYHFARPAYPLAATAKAQASYFAKLIGDVDTPATLPPALDLEVTGGLSRADLVSWAQIFLYRMRTLTGRTPILYTYPSFWTDVLADPTAFSRFPLWMASYASTVPADPELWQFTDSASISGISGRVDESRYVPSNGLPWATLSDGTAVAPWTAAAPSPPHALSVVAGPASATVSWVPGNDGSNRTTSYTVTSNPGGVTATANGAATSATVTGLDPTTAYTFTVTATSSAGTSVPSAATQSVTPIVATQLALTQPADIDYGHSLAISAVLTRPDTSAGVGNQPVTIYRRASGKTAWAKRGTVTTASDGSIALRLHPTRSVDVKLAFHGAPGYEPDSARSTTVVHSVVTAALSRAKVKHGKHVKLTGTVMPVIAGEQVIRQELIGKTWQNGPAKTVDKDGGFSFRLHPRKNKTTHTYRIFVASGHRLGSAASPVLILTVK